MLSPQQFFEMSAHVNHYKFVQNEMYNERVEKCKIEIFTYLDNLKARTYSLERYILGGLILRGKLPKSVIGKVENICILNQIPFTHEEYFK